MKDRWVRLFWLFVILGAGVYLRLAHLGVSAFRSDTIEFWKICHQPLSAVTIWQRWMEIMGETGHSPLAMAFTKGFIDVLRLPVTDTAVRLPGAVLGILAIPLAYLAGAVFRGPRFGLMFAALLAFNPILIQACREAYFYSPMQPGVVLLLWSLLWTWRHRYRPRLFPWYFHATTGLGFFLTAYSHLTGWWFCFPALVLTGAILVTRALRWRRAWCDFVGFSMVCGLVGVPLLVLPWALPLPLHSLLDSEAKAKAVRTMATQFEPTLRILRDLGTSLAWGTTPFRCLLVVVALALGARLMLLRPSRNLVVMMIVGTLAVGVGIHIVGHRVSGLPAGMRYATSLQLAYTFVLLVGLTGASSFPRVRSLLSRRWRRAPDCLLFGLSLALQCEPAFLSTRIRGGPRPHKDTVAAVDAAVPRGTLVLVDRWLDPWNELKVHNSTNVVFTFTVPSEPEDVRQQLNWWQTVKDFFEKFPDAAYLENAYSYKPVDGEPWPWPRQHFARHIAISDEYSRRLEQMGLAYRGYQAVFFHYNTLGDTLAKARQEGRSTLVLYGPGWGYTKLWQQVRGDFRDWRVLGGQADIVVHNLTPVATNVTVRLSGVAVNGSKGVRASTGASREFPQGQIVEWIIDSVLLVPGANTVMLQDAGGGQRRAVLLVSSVRVE